MAKKQKSDRARSDSKKPTCKDCGRPLEVVMYQDGNKGRAKMKRLCCEEKGG